MATGSLRKHTAPAGPRRSRFKARSTVILDRMAPLESACILRAVLAKRPDLRAEAEQIAIAMMAAPIVEDVANAVDEAVTALDIESLHGRVGKQAGGDTSSQQKLPGSWLAKPSMTLSLT